MELKIVNKKEEPLLSRTKIETEIVFENATPSREEIKSKLARDVGKDGKLVVQAAAAAQKTADHILGVKWEGGAK